jgi:hypothetical protein
MSACCVAAFDGPPVEVDVEDEEVSEPVSWLV